MRLFTTALAAALICSAAATAQFLPSRPTTGSPLSGGIGTAPASAGFSPYLNLARGGNSAAVNYYGIVRPQINMQAQLQNLQQQQTSGAASFEPDDPSMPGLVVGTRVRFLSTSGYFLNLQGGTTTQGATSGGYGGGASGRSGSAAQGSQGSGLSTGLGGFGTGTGSSRGSSKGSK